MKKIFLLPLLFSLGCVSYEDYHAQKKKYDELLDEAETISLENDQLRKENKNLKSKQCNH